MKKKIVTIGGGKGQAALLAGLVEYDVELTAVVSVMDSGGSSGVLREQEPMLPPGDLRRTLAALTSVELTTLWNSRRTDGHAEGNIVIRDLLKRSATMTEALQWLGQEVGARGRVLPVTETLTTLVATLVDGSEVRSETAIDIPSSFHRSPIRSLRLDPLVQTTPEVRDALLQADVIILTMGDLFTSLLPNLLVQGVADAIAESDAMVVGICNRTTKQGETDTYTTRDFHSVWTTYLAPATVDMVLVDASDTPVPEGHERVRYEPLPGVVNVIQAHLVDDAHPEYISGLKAARVIMDLCTS